MRNIREKLTNSLFQKSASLEYRIRHKLNLVSKVDVLKKTYKNKDLNTANQGITEPAAPSVEHKDFAPGIPKMPTPTKTAGVSSNPDGQKLTSLSQPQEKPISNIVNGIQDIKKKLPDSLVKKLEQDAGTYQLSSDECNAQDDSRDRDIHDFITEHLDAHGLDSDDESDEYSAATNVHMNAMLHHAKRIDRENAQAKDDDEAVFDDLSNFARKKFGRAAQTDQSEGSKYITIRAQNGNIIEKIRISDHEPSIFRQNQHGHETFSRVHTNRDEYHAAIKEAKARLEALDHKHKY